MPLSLPANDKLQAELDYRLAEAPKMETFEDLVSYAVAHPDVRGYYLPLERFMEIWLGVSLKIFKRCCKVTTNGRSFIQIGNFRVMPTDRSVSEMMSSEPIPETTRSITKTRR